MLQQNTRLFSFVAGKSGRWQITQSTAVVGEPLPPAARLEIIEGPPPAAASVWTLSGVTSNERYVNREEKIQLVGKQASLGRPQATHGAVIPIRKNARWWGLTQQERREIFEEQSHHTAVGLKYLPAIARRLHHCRDLAIPQSFDFITLFDFSKADSNAFDDLLAALRTTEEWKYIDREVDIRMIKE